MRRAEEVSSRGDGGIGRWMYRRMEEEEEEGRGGRRKRRKEAEKDGRREGGRQEEGRGECLWTYLQARKASRYGIVRKSAIQIISN